MPEYDWPVITKSTSLEEIKRIHQMIWDYVIEFGEKPNVPYLGRCAVCQYECVHHRVLGNKCFDCLIEWNGEHCYSRGAEYQNWIEADDPIKEKELAKIIRDIPFKFEKEER